MLSDIQIKCYLEGLEVPIENAYITSISSPSAVISISKINRHLFNLKPGMLLHLFIFLDNEWRLFYVGKYVSITVTRSSAQLTFSSLFSELDKAIYAPINLGDSTYGNSIPSLYVSNSDLLTRSNTSGSTQVLIATSEGELEYMSYTDLQQNGTVTSYIQSLLKGARTISPWYKIQSDLHNLDDFYYILDNPNIFPVMALTSVSKLITDSLSKFDKSISYSQIINFLLHQLRYKTVELNTPIYVNGSWKWVLLLPDYTWLESYKDITIQDNELLQLEIEDSVGYSPTRMRINLNSGQEELDQISQQNYGFIYTYPDVPFIEQDNKYYIHFTPEEQYSGVRAEEIYFDDVDTFYSMIDWSKNPTLLRTSSDPKGIATLPLNTSNKYYKDLAQYKFVKSRLKRNVGSTFIPIYDPKFRGIFPVKMNLFPEFTFVLSNISFSFSGSSVSMNIMPASIGDEVVPQLNWDPDEYKTPQKFYATFNNDRLITEAEFWKLMGVNFAKKLNPLFYKSSKLDALYIAHLQDSKNIKTDFLKTIFCYERALPVKQFLESAYDVKINLPLVPQMDMTTQTAAHTPVTSAGGIHFDKTAPQTLSNNSPGVNGPTVTGALYTILKAMASHEGFYQKGSRSQRNNNPGNLEFHQWETSKYGATLENSTNPRFAKFPTPAAGWNAFTDLVTSYANKNYTISGMINVWAPPSENDTQSYIDQILKALGINNGNYYLSSIIGK